MLRHRLIGLGAGSIALAVLLAAPGAMASSNLRYEAPEAEGCPSAGDFRDALAARLGEDPFGVSPMPSASIRIELARGAFSGTLRLATNESRPVERAFVARRCDELVRAMVVAVAVMLDPLGERQPAASRASVPAPPPMTPPREPEQLPAPPPPAHALERPTLRLEGDAGGIGSVGVFPSVGLGGKVAFGVRGVLWSLRVEGRFMSTLGDVELGGTGKTSSSLLDGGLAGCYEPAWGFGCIVTMAGSFRARADFVERPATRSAFWLGSGLRIGTARRLGSSSWALVPHIEGIVPLLATNLEIDDGRRLWEPPPVAFAFGISARTSLQ